jgi:hypothetical protein
MELLIDVVNHVSRNICTAVSSLEISYLIQNLLELIPLLRLFDGVDRAELSSQQFGLQDLDSQYNVSPSSCMYVCILWSLETMAD